MSKRKLIFNLPYNCDCIYAISNNLRFLSLLIKDGITNIEKFNDKIKKIQLLEFLQFIAHENKEYFIEEFEYIKKNIETGISGKQIYENIFKIFYGTSDLKNINIDEIIKLNDDYKNLISEYFDYDEGSFKNFINSLRFKRVFYDNFNISVITKILIEKSIDDFMNELVDYFKEFNKNYEIIINIATETEKVGGDSYLICNSYSLMSKFNTELYKKLIEYEFIDINIVSHDYVISNPINDSYLLVYSLMQCEKDNDLIFFINQNLIPVDIKTIIGNIEEIDKNKYGKHYDIYKVRTNYITNDFIYEDYKINFDEHIPIFRHDLTMNVIQTKLKNYELNELYNKIITNSTPRTVDRYIFGTRFTIIPHIEYKAYTMIKEEIGELLYWEIFQKLQKLIKIDSDESFIKAIGLIRNYIIDNSKIVLKDDVDNEIRDALTYIIEKVIMCKDFEFFEDEDVINIYKSILHGLPKKKEANELLYLCIGEYIKINEPKWICIDRKVRVSNKINSISIRTYKDDDIYKLVETRSVYTMYYCKHTIELNIDTGKNKTWEELWNENGKNIIYNCDYDEKIYYTEYTYIPNTTGGYNDCKKNNLKLFDYILIFFISTTIIILVIVIICIITKQHKINYFQNNIFENNNYFLQ